MAELVDARDLKSLGPKIRAGSSPALGKFIFAHVDLDTFVKEFLTYFEANHRIATTARYRAAIDNFLRFIREKNKIKRLSDITTDTVEQYKVWRRSSIATPNGVIPKQVKPQYLRRGAKTFTINFEITTLKTMLNLAVEWKRLETNPAKAVKTLKTDDSKKGDF